jgi:hypothetical protein
MRRKAIEHEDFGRVFKNGGANFINKGTNQRWRDVLTEPDLAK